MRALVFSPHPDDESLGCGGTLRKHIVEGDEVRIVFLTSGEQGGHERAPNETAQLREREATRAATILGIDDIEFWRFTDGKLRADRALVGRMTNAISHFGPDRIYVTHTREQHPDHRAAGRAVGRALAGVRAAPQVLYFEVWTPLQRLDVIVDISDHIDAKISAIQAHATQCAVLEFDEAFRGLARYRGEMHSWPGGPYAEVFAG